MFRHKFPKFLTRLAVALRHGQLVNSFCGNETVMRMIGVVLWSDPLAGKAVFWCEDQGDLAYFDGLNEDTDIKKAFAAGDMVSFDVRRDREFRRLRRAVRKHGAGRHLRRLPGAGGVAQRMRAPSHRIDGV